MPKRRASRACGAFTGIIDPEDPEVASIFRRMFGRTLRLERYSADGSLHKGSKDSPYTKSSEDYSRQ